MKRKIELLVALIVLGLGSALAQKVAVRGTVTDETGEPIIGATVREREVPSNGTATDLDGKFSLHVGKQNATLVISYVGYKTVEMMAMPEMSVSLQPDNELLDEVIVVAFGTARKSAFTGSAVQIESKDLASRQVTTITQALTGRVPGVTIRSGNNQPGSGASVQIRGKGSFAASSKPLYVVDGVPYDGDITAINPQDIASVSILKDAASAALYGARGANGVVLLTTKSGSAKGDKINISLEARYGVNSRAVPDYDVIRDPKVYASKYFEAIYNAFATRVKDADQVYDKSIALYFSPNPKTANLKYHPFTFPDRARAFRRQADGSFVMDPEATVGTLYTSPSGEKYWLQPDNWTDEVFENRPRQEYNLSLSGASSMASYFLSTGYLNDKGYISGSDYERFTARIKGDYKPFRQLTIGANVALSHYVTNSLRNVDSPTSSGNIFALTGFIAPVYPMYVRGAEKEILEDKWGFPVYDFGNETFPGLNRPYLTCSNPKSTNTLDRDDSQADMVSARGYVDLHLLEGLKLTANIGYDTDNTYNTSIVNPIYGQNAQAGGQIGKLLYRSHALNLQQLLSYVTSIDRHNVSLLAGHEYYKRRRDRFSGSRQNIYLLTATELDGAISHPSVGSTHADYLTEGYLGRLQYDYDSRYFLSASYRRDASSRFSEGHRWGNFWSLGGSWLLSREKWLRPASDWLDLLKVKLSYGVQGNDAIPSFAYEDIYKLKNVDGHFAIEFDSKGKEDLTWETSHNLNAGLEFSLLGDRLSGSIDLYSREVTDMLFWHTTPKSGGYGGYYDNIGAMRNRGVDISLTAVLFRTPEVEWTAFVNAGHNRNTLTKLPDDWASVEGGYRSGNSLYRIGGSLDDRVLPHYLGVNEKGEATWSHYDKATGTTTPTTDPRLASEKESLRLYESLAPKLAGGLGTNLSLYGIDLGLTLTYQIGGKILDGTYAQLMHSGRSHDTGTAWHRDILRSWTPERKETDVPMVNYAGKYGDPGSDRFLTSRSYLALDNITLGYTLPQEWISSLSLSGARIYLVADNVALLSARRGFDPRFGGGVGYKAIRTVSGGFRLTF